MMNDLFDLPVSYKGERLLFKAQLLQEGYIHKFRVLIEDNEVIFEPDEESNYRAMVDPAQFDNMKIDMELVKKIAETLSEL